MRPLQQGPRVVGLDALGLAVGTALVAGALSLVAPFLIALTGTLAALSVTSWAMVQTSGGSRGRWYAARARITRLSILAVGATVFLVPPRELTPFRGLLLAVSLVPLWWGERGQLRQGRGRNGPR